MVTLRPWQGPPRSFIWNNSADAVPRDGWRYANGSVDAITGCINLDYHRIERAGCSSECTDISDQGCVCHFHGQFDTDCNHMAFPDSGAWARQGAPPRPTAPAALALRTTMSQDVAAATTTLVTTLRSLSSVPLNISLQTWTFNSPDATSRAGINTTTSSSRGSFRGARGRGGGGTFLHTSGRTPSDHPSADPGACFVWAARDSQGTTQRVTGVLTTRMLSGPAVTCSTDGSGDSDNEFKLSGGDIAGIAWINFTLGPGETASLGHVVISDLAVDSGLDPVVAATTATKTLTPSVIADIDATAETFWASFWNASSISLPGYPDVEAYWFVLLWG